MKPCAHCGEEFEPTRRDQLYHSDACRKAAARARAGRDDEYRSIFHEWLVEPSLNIDRDQRAVLEEYRAQVEGTNTAGGYLCPPDFAAMIVEAAVGLSAIARLATQLETSDGTALPVPLLTVHGTSAWVAEQGSSAATDPTFAQGSLGGFKGMTKVIGSEELSRDSALDLDTLLARELGNRLGVLQGTAFAQGDGSGKPMGVATTGSGFPVVNGASGSGTSYNRVDLKAVYKALPAAYRPRATWVMHPDDFAELWDRSAAAGDAPAFPSLHGDNPTLYGRPVEIDPFMPTPANNAHSLAFGDIEAGYAVRRVTGIGVQKLDELHSDTGQVGWRAIERVDGRPLLTDAIRLLKHVT